jgi:CheY-like chemotaxis protein
MTQLSGNGADLLSFTHPKVRSKYTAEDKRLFQRHDDVLIVESHPLVAKLLVRMLQPYFKSATIAINTHEAATLVEQSRFQIVIISMEPGSRRGFELVERYTTDTFTNLVNGSLKARRASISDAMIGRASPTIMLGMTTARGTAFDHLLREAQAVGFRTVLKLPFSIAELIAAAGDTALSAMLSITSLVE